MGAVDIISNLDRGELAAEIDYFILGYVNKHILYSQAEVWAMAD